MSDINRVGARVRIRQSVADRYLQPLRDWGNKGRAGTVDMIGTLDFQRGHVRVLFDTKRTPKWAADYIHWLPAKDLEPAA
jgi:hypothetical protein